MVVGLNIDLFKALPRETKLKDDDNYVWTSFRYEQLPTFCTYCGFLGHGDKACKQRQHDIRVNQVKDGQFGDWLRATVFRVKKKDEHAQNVTSNETGVECQDGSAKIDHHSHNPQPYKPLTPSSNHPNILTLPSHQPEDLNLTKVGGTNNVNLITLPSTSFCENQPMNLEHYLVDPIHTQTSALINIPILTESPLLPLKETQNTKVERLSVAAQCVQESTSRK